MIGLEDAGRHHRPSTGTDLAETAARALRGRGVFLLGGKNFPQSSELPPRRFGQVWCLSSEALIQIQIQIQMHHVYSDITNPVIAVIKLATVIQVQAEYSLIW